MEVRYTYDPLDRIENIQYGNGIKTTYAYDCNGNISQLETKTNDAVLLSFTYQYDGNGNRTAKIGTQGMTVRNSALQSSVMENITEGSSTLQSAIMANITEGSSALQPAAMDIRYQYDIRGQLLEERRNGAFVHYMYDATGNRIRKTNGDKETRYHYNQKNQLLKEENTEGINYFTYDKQGGIVKEKTSSGIRKFTYNSKHQQTRIETEDGRIQENRYDAEGLCYDLIGNGKRTCFIYHNGELLYEKEETEQSKEETSYQLGAGIEALQRSQRTYYYHQDEQLNTALITNRKGEIKNPYQYDAFGNGLEAIEELPNRIRYTGQQYDQQTEQYYLRARYYNPIAGRFMQEDVYQGDGLNLYAYCRNNPVVYFDPSGYGKKYNNGLDEIPSVSEGFKKWFDTTDWREFDQIWKVKEQREYIESQIRAPGKLHEWLMAGKANTFKYWGVSMDEIKLNRDVISGLEFKNPHGFHGKKGSGTAHNEIKSIIDSSLNYDDYKRRLRAWADYRLPEIKINGITYPGSVRLPGNLQNQEAINYINRLHNEQTQEQNKTYNCGGK